MKILIGCDKDGLELKKHLIEHLSKNNEVVDKTPNGSADFVESTTIICNAIMQKEGDRGILIDKTGIGSFISANKFKGIVCAQVADEHSAHMTIDHNGTPIISMGSDIVGVGLAKNIVDLYLSKDYSAGRHQVRVDMLNKML